MIKFSSGFVHTTITAIAIIACGTCYAQEPNEPTTATDGHVRIHNDGPASFFRRKKEIRPTERTGSAVKKKKEKPGEHVRNQGRVYRRHSLQARQSDYTRKRARGSRKNYLTTKE